MNFKPLDNYNGDVILIDRLAEFFINKSMTWNDGENIGLYDITRAIFSNQPEETLPYGDIYKHPYNNKKSTKWHIGRIIYFIRHSEEIRDIEIDNLSDGAYILPIPVISDGNHRFMAAMWLKEQGKLNTVHCIYAGRTDLLDYLQGRVDICPD